MAVDLSILNTLVAKFRKGSPNIAAAFDEVGKLLVKSDAELWNAIGLLSSRVSELEGEPPPPPPPPPPVGSPLAFRADVPASYWPSNIGSYAVAVTYGPQPAAFRGVNLIYRTAITATGTTNISEQEVLANNWQLKNSSGQPLRHSSGGWVLADVGIPAYRTRWIAAAKAQIGAVGSDGLWVDDINPRPESLSGGVRPANYPTNASYEEACRGFAAAVKASGLVAAYNTFIGLDDNAALTTAYWQTLAPHVHYLTAEYWLTPGSFTRRVGPEWFNHWDEHRNLHKLCNNAGVGFLPNDSRHSKLFGAATFMLDYDGQGAYMWSPSDQPYGGDPWDSTWAKLAVLGAPSGPAVKGGNVWSRQFANGRITVDPVAGTATIV